MYKKIICLKNQNLYKSWIWWNGKLKDWKERNTDKKNKRIKRHAADG